MVRRKGEFFVVCDGVKHGFESFDAFVRLGLHKDLGHQVSSADIDSIPSGAVITARGIVAGAANPLSGLCSKYSFSPLLPPEQANHGSSSESATKTTALQAAILGHVDKPPSGSSSGRIGAVDCEVNAALDALVVANSTRSILYLVSHDNASEALAMKFALCKEAWVRPVRIASTVFFESVMFRDVFAARTAEWASVDYVITATYKTVAKQLHYNGFNQNLAMIRTLLETARNGQYDIVPFLRSGSGTMSFCLYWHGEPFRTAWDALLTEMGYNISTIRSLDEAKPFYRNIYIIRPAVLQGLTAFMTRAMAIAAESPRVKAALSANSNYKEGQEEVAVRIFGTKYYQLHPFVFERLPSFYLHSTAASICHYSHDGPCKYNS